MSIGLIPHNALDEFQHMLLLCVQLHLQVVRLHPRLVPLRFGLSQRPSSVLDGQVRVGQTHRIDTLILERLRHASLGVGNALGGVAKLDGIPNLLFLGAATGCSTLRLGLLVKRLALLVDGLLELTLTLGNAATMRRLQLQLGIEHAVGSIGHFVEIGYLLIGSSLVLLVTCRLQVLHVLE